PSGFGADALVATTAPTQYAPLRSRPGSVAVSDQGCSANDGRLVAGEYGFLSIPLENIGRTALAGVTATLSSLSANVTVLTAVGSYGAIASGGNAPNAAPFVLRLEPAFDCGSTIRLRLAY